MVEQKAYNKEWENWLQNRLPDNPYALTLYLKQRYHIPKNTKSSLYYSDAVRRSTNIDALNFPTYVNINEELAKQNFRHFHNLLNRSLFKGAAKRRNKKVECISCYRAGISI